MFEYLLSEQGHDVSIQDDQRIDVMMCYILLFAHMHYMCVASGLALCPHPCFNLLHIEGTQPSQHMCVEWSRKRYVFRYSQTESDLMACI
jgi:hypothetical protein